jgi:hypothetical protein
MFDNISDLGPSLGNDQLALATRRSARTGQPGRQLVPRAGDASMNGAPAQTA